MLLRTDTVLHDPGGAPGNNRAFSPEVLPSTLVWVSASSTNAFRGKHTARMLPVYASRFRLRVSRNTRFRPGLGLGRTGQGPPHRVTLEGFCFLASSFTRLA